MSSGLGGTTIAITLGAWEWPLLPVDEMPSARIACDQFKQYLNCSEKGLGLRDYQILDKFGADEAPVKILKDIESFLNEHLTGKTTVYDLIIYCVSHGGTDSYNGKYGIFLRNTEDGVSQELTYFPIQKLGDLLLRYCKQLRCYLIIDACFSGAIRNHFTNPDFFLWECPEPIGLAYLTSSRSYEASEWRDVSSPPTFSKELLDILKNGIATQTGKLSLDDIHQEILQRWTSSTNKAQCPDAQFAISLSKPNVLLYKFFPNNISESQSNDYESYEAFENAFKTQVNALTEILRREDELKNQLFNDLLAANQIDKNRGENVGTESFIKSLVFKFYTEWRRALTCLVKHGPRSENVIQRRELVSLTTFFAMDPRYASSLKMRETCFQVAKGRWRMGGIESMLIAWTYRSPDTPAKHARPGPTKAGERLAEPPQQGADIHIFKSHLLTAALRGQTPRPCSEDRVLRNWLSWYSQKNIPIYRHVDEAQQALISQIVRDQVLTDLVLFVLTHQSSIKYDKNGIWDDVAEFYLEQANDYIR